MKPGSPVIERQFASLVRASIDAIISLDHKGRITIWNRAATKMFGYTAREARGRPLHELLVPDSMLEKARKGFSRFTRTGKGPIIGKSTECIARRKDGSEFPVSLSISAYQQEGHWQATGIIRDISKYKNLEAHIAESKENYRQLIENVGSAVTLFDENGTLLFINRLGARILGGTPTDFIGKSIQTLFPETGKIYLGRIRQILRSGKGKEYEDKVELPAGPKWFWSRLHPVRDADNTFYAVQIISHDITARKLAEERLRQNEEKFRKLVESQAAAHWSMDVDNGCFTYMGRQIEKMLGYPASSWTSLDTWASRIHPEDREAAVRYCQQATRHGKDHDFEYRMIAKNGNIVWIRDIVTVIMEKGRPKEILGLLIDVTDEKLARFELQREQQRTRQIIETARDAFISMNDKGQITDWNMQAEHMFGWSREEVLGRTVAEAIIPERFREAHIAGLTRYLTTGKPGAMLNRHVEATAQHRDGHEIPVEISIVPLHLNSTTSFHAFIRDISKQQKTKAQILRSERRVRLLLDSTAEGIYGLDTEGNCTFANASCCRLLGYDTPEELVGANMHGLIHHTRPDGSHYPARECHILKAFRQGVGAHVDDEVLWRRDGSSFPAAYWAFPIFEADRVVGAVVTFLDITEQVRARDALQKSHEQLLVSLHGTISAICKAVEARDPYTAGHQKRVAQLAHCIAQEIGLDMDRIDGLRMGATIHDIGKIHLPAEILSKPTRLTEMEFELIKSHCKVGYDILKDIVFPWPVADIAHQHHERLDGSGYPQGLKGDEICLEARIVAVADVVEAMSSHRPYRPALGIDAALEEIKTHRGRWFEPDIVDACLTLFRKKAFSFERER